MTKNYPGASELQTDDCTSLALLKEFEMTETARLKEIEKPGVDLKNFHASPETHARITEMLK